MHPKTILIISAGSALVALLSFFASIVALGKARRLSRAGYALEGDFENSITEFSNDLDTLSRKVGEQARKIAWLETRARANRDDQPVVAERVNGDSLKPNITERRHRILTLVRRGQDAQTIAHTLGIPQGEVELMINLLKAA